MRDDVEEIEDMVCVIETTKAIMVRRAGPSATEREGTWVPKSVIHDDSEVYDMKDGAGPGKLVVLRWFAEKEGLG